MKPRPVGSSPTPMTPSRRPVNPRPLGDGCAELSIGTAIDLVVEGQNGDTFGIAVCSLRASILPGSETSQGSHTIWHETVLSIDSRNTP